MQVLQGGLVLTERLELEHADLVVENGMIRSIEPAHSVTAADAATIDCSRRILVPGLINAHTHSAGNLVRSWTDQWTLELQLSGGPALRGSPSAGDKYLSALLGAAEMISRGCTACYDLFYEFPVPTVEGLLAVGKAYDEAGMRAVIAPMLADVSFYQSIPGLLESLPQDVQERAARAMQTPWETVAGIVREALELWPYDRSRINLALAPTIPMHCTDGYLRRAAAFCRDAGIPFHTHLAESKPQAVNGLRRYGKSITAHLESIGVLSERFTAAHCVWIDDDDVQRLADCGCSVAHCPGSNMRLGNGMAAARRMLDRKLNVGVGTDSRLCSDNLNMFEAMRLVSFVSRVQGPDRGEWVGTQEAFRMATEGSARSLGLKGVGALAPGRRADIVFLDAANTNYVPLNDIVNQLVHAEDATAVAEVMIDGRMVYAAGAFSGFDASLLPARAEDAVTRLRNATREARSAAARLEPVVAAFCGGLARQPHHIRRYGGGEG